MNERIKELAREAGLEYDFNPMLWLKHEKFAELIVRECARVIDRGDGEMSSIDILKHFGVE